MNILGLSFDYHDAAAALVVDGTVVSAIQEERLSRVKHDRRLPKLSIEHCLRTAGLSLSDLDAVVYYENPFKKFERLVLNSAFKKPRWLTQTFQDWLANGKIDIKTRLQIELGIEQERIFLCDHHQSHAASAFFCSPFDEAAIITLDGVGESETATISVGRGTSIQKLSSVTFPHSIGLLYSAFTAFLGFEVNEGEYKVMGMAGFGVPQYADRIRKLLRLTETGFEVDQSYFNFQVAEDSFLSEKFTATFGAPRQANDGFSVTDGPIIEENRHYADMAASLQTVTEELIVHYGRLAMKQTGLSKIVMAGGVALNSLANARLVRELGVDLYVQPAAGDSGAALGAALAHHCAKGGRRPPKLSSLLLGGSYDDTTIREALQKQAITAFEHIENEEILLNHVAEALAEGQVIGWFQGRSEWGPRALGSRSILSRPFPKEAQTRINEKIKFREPFRPFAPAVLAEKATIYFDLQEPTERTQPESYMLSIAQVRPEMREKIPAVTHVDGTARLQLVWREEGTRYRRLIEFFDKKTGIPVLLNTSFNRRGEPVVETPHDALMTFLWSDLDILVLGSYIIRKDQLA
jgi:carbamoyltransferase